MLFSYVDSNKLITLNRNEFEKAIAENLSGKAIDTKSWVGFGYILKSTLFVFEYSWRHKISGFWTLIKSEISSLSNKIIPDENILIINYYHGLDKCNSSGDKSYAKAKYARYLKKLKKFENISQFFIYKSPEGIKKYGEKLNWIKDEFKTIEKIFLPIHYPCGSCVLIDKNGNYVTIKGEYDIERIIDMIKNEKETFDIDED